MTTHTHTYKLRVVRINLVYELDEYIEKLMPHRSMAIAVGVMFSGLCIPALMAIQVLPLTFLLGFGGFALTATGSVLALIFSGEIA